MKKNGKDIILFAGNVPDRHIESIIKLEKKLKTKYRIFIITDPDIELFLTPAFLKKIDTIIYCNGSDLKKIKAEIKPIMNDILTVIFVYEKFAELYRNVTKILKLSNSSSLEAIKNCTDKIMMRKAFYKFDPSITPKFLLMRNKRSLKKIEKKIGYPCILKPAHLSKSRLVTVSENMDQLKKNLDNTLKIIDKIYKEDKVGLKPLIIAEEMMIGKMYTVDAYIDEKNNVYFTPVVSIITGKNLGIDDFFNYARIMPADLGAKEIAAAYEVTRKGIIALGLKRSVGHVELIRTDSGWKLVEIGSRIGGYRTKMLRLSYGIDHIENMLLIKLGEKPNTECRLLAHTAVIELFPEKEGYLNAIHGIDKVRKLKSYFDLQVQKRKGDRIGFSKNGNLCVMYVILNNKNENIFKRDFEEIRKIIKIET